MTCKAVLFDLDGTLLDTLDDLADSMNAVLADHGLPPHPTDAYRYFVGDGIENLGRRVLPADRAGDEALVRQVVEAMWHAYHARRGARSRPYPGIAELLDGLTARGLKMAILSNKPDDLAQLIVGELLGDWHFDPLRGARPGVPVKPDPTAALEVVAGLGVPAGRVLYLGDTATDMRCAVNAGTIPVGATWGFRPGAELTAAGATALVDHPVQLLDLL